MTADAAAATIAAARCEHASTCGQVGTGHAFATADACTAELTRNAGADLARHPCPDGIDSNEVAACVRLLKAESCYPLSTLSRMYACRPANLCLRTGTVRLSEEEIYGE